MSTGPPTGVRSLSRDGEFELVYQSTRARVRRWRSRTDPGCTLIVKDPLGDGAGPRLQRERAVLTRLADVPGVPHLREAGEGLDPDTIVEEDAGDRTLAQALPPAGWPPGQVVELGIGLARTLAGMHRRGVVHRDVNPPNIVLTPGNDPVLVDFDLASTYAQERPSFAHTTDILGTLAYLAPEQTGRTGRVIDHRADLYSLGATLYEAATGSPPFGFAAPLQLVHDQLARVPTPLSTVDPRVPAELSQVVARLLEKEPDARYESAEGVLHDLCLVRDLLAGRPVAPFHPGERDYPLRLTAPSRPVGRATELAELQAQLRAALSGTCRCVLVGGPTGVGKSALANELRPAVAAAGGWFVAGAFDTGWQDVADGPFAQVLRGLGRLLLAEPDPEPSPLRSALHDVLDEHGGRLALLPEYAALLDPPAGTAAETEPGRSPGPLTAAALSGALVDLLRAMTSPRRPVVVLIDDLDRAGPADLDLLESLLTEQLPPGLLLIGTHRDTDPGHPLSQRRARWAQATLAPVELTLADLPEESLAELVGAMLHLPVDRVRELAAVVAQSTGGIPSRAVELLNALRADGLVAPADTGWTWDVEGIRRYVADHDVGGLLSGRVAGLPAPTRAGLEVLDCLGGRAAPELLAVAAGSDPDQVLADLEPAFREGLLVTGPDGAPRLRQDRIVQAVWSGSSERHRQEVHLAVARRLAERPGLEDRAGEQYLTVLGGRGGRDAVTDPQECLTAAALLHRAARTADTDPAHADRLLAVAADVLTRLTAGGSGTSPGIRDAVAELAAQVQVDRHRTLFRLGRVDAADAHYAAIAARCDDPAALIGPTCVQVDSLTGQARPDDALALALDLLARLGLRPPADPADWAEGELDALVRWVARAGDRERTRPEPDDPQLTAVTTLIHHALAPALLTDPAVHRWLVLAGQRSWRERGPCPAVVADAGAAAALLIGHREDYRTAYRLGDLALATARRHGYEDAAARLRARFAAAVGHWFEPLEEQIGPLRAAREGLLRAGDTTAAALTSTALAAALLDRGPTLDVCAREVDAGLALAARTGSQHATGNLLAYRQLLRALRGETVPAGSFEGPDFCEAFHLVDPGVTAQARTVYRVNRALGAALLGDGEALWTQAGAAVGQLDVVPGLWVSAQARLLHALALAERLRDARTAPDQRDRLLTELDACRDRLAARAADAPDNVGHLVDLVEAERHWARGDTEAAAVAFDRALGRPSVYRRPWQEALIAERTGLFLLAAGRLHLGHEQLARARAGYAEWGAGAVVARLERCHPALRQTARGGFAVLPAVPVAAAGQGMTASGPGTVDPAVPGGLGPGMSNEVDANMIDLLGVLSAARALGQERNLDRLRDRIAQVVGDLTGATAVRVLLWNEEARDWFLLCGDDGQTALPLEPAAARGMLPLAAIRTVERTREPLLVPDAVEDDRFAHDRFLAGLEHCSLMVVPIRSQGRQRAMLVLENRLSRGAFTRDRLGAVLLIAGQLAVSLGNALAERFRSLVQRSSDVMLVCGQGGRVGYASSAAHTLFGVPAAQLSGQAVDSLVHTEDGPALLAQVRLTAAGTGPGEAQGRPLECRVRRGDGVERWVEITFTDLTGDPAVGGVVLHLRDVSERHRLEIELRHAQKMESVGQLAAGVAHEINNPIQFIGDNLAFLDKAFTDLCRVVEALRDAVPAADVPLPAEPAARRDAARALLAETDLDYLLTDVPGALGETQQGVARVAKIVRAMKASVYHSGEHRAQADLNELVRNTLVVANSELKYVADVREELGNVPPIWCFPGDLHQVVLNLVVNAAQAIAEAVAAGAPNGRITVRTWQEDDEVGLDVADTGVGIPPEIAGRVFEQFFTTKPVGVGTGQGLTLAYYLVHDRHHGTITFTSEPGAGTTFTVRLPIGSPEERRDDTPPPTATPPRRV